MTPDRHRYWSAYIADVQRRMLLADWHIELRREPPESPNADAAVETPGPSRDARLYLAKFFDARTRTEQRWAIVHELVHLHMRPMKEHLAMQVRDAKGIQFIKAGHHSHEEYAVDDLARIIAPSMPLPPKVKP